MLKGLQITFSLIGLSLAIYYFISDNKTIMPYMLIALALMFFPMGMNEIKAKRKEIGMACFLLGAAILFLISSEIFR